MSKSTIHLAVKGFSGQILNGLSQHPVNDQPDIISGIQRELSDYRHVREADTKDELAKAQAASQAVIPQTSIVEAKHETENQ